MEKTIKTPHGTISFTPIEIKRGRKKLDLQIAKKNLQEVHRILTGSNIRWGLIYGTLLGAMREKNFITHDEDTDIFVLYEDKVKFINHLNIFIDNGFRIARINKFLLSIIRDGEYIDIYFFKRYLFYRKADSYRVKKIYFKSIDYINFFGKDYPTVNKPLSFLEFTYGKSWITPIENAHASAVTSKYQQIIVPMIVYCYKNLSKIFK